MNYLFNLLNGLDSEQDVILIGELHGTRQIPLLIIDALTLFIQKGKSFDLFLEIPCSEQKIIDAFLESKDESLLLESSFFNEPASDGRNSREWFDVIRQLGFLNRQCSLDCRIVCLDIDSFESLPSKITRDKVLADNVLKNLRSDRLTFIVLGQVHASQEPLLFGNHRVLPAGWYLSSVLGKSLYSVCLHAKTGGFYSHGRQVLDDLNDQKEFISKDLFDEIILCDVVSPASFLWKKDG